MKEFFRMYTYAAVYMIGLLGMINLVPCLDAKHSIPNPIVIALYVYIPVCVDCALTYMSVPYPWLWNVLESWLTLTPEALLLDNKNPPTAFVVSGVRVKGNV